MKLILYQLVPLFLKYTSMHQSHFVTEKVISLGVSWKLLLVGGGGGREQTQGRVKKDIHGTVESRWIALTQQLNEPWESA